MPDYDVNDILKVLYITKSMDELEKIINSREAVAEYVEEVHKTGEIPEILKEFESQVVKPLSLKFETNIENPLHLGSHTPVILYTGDLNYTKIGAIDLFMEDDTLMPYFISHLDRLEGHTYACMQHNFPDDITDFWSLEIYDGRVWVLQIVGPKQTLMYLGAKISNQCVATQGEEDFVSLCDRFMTGTETVNPIFTKFAIPAGPCSKCNQLIKSHTWTLADCIGDFTNDLDNKKKAPPKEK